jgi:hypothetical protein
MLLYQVPVTKLALLLFMKDGRPGIPIGSATWNSEERTHRVRIFNRVACPSCITDGDYLLIELAGDHLKQWVEKGLPYPEGQKAPYEDAFWEVVQDLLIHRVRLMMLISDEVAPNNRVKVLH